MHVRRLNRDDAEAVTALLSDLDYPGAQEWLARRLADVVAGRASGAVVTGTIAGSVIGVVIVAPKPRGLKICTLAVDPAHRRRGVGAALLDSAMETARTFDRPIYLTADAKQWPELAPLLTSRGFEVVAHLPDRYHHGRTEVVACAPAPGRVA